MTSATKSSNTKGEDMKVRKLTVGLLVTSLVFAACAKEKESGDGGSSSGGKLADLPRAAENDDPIKLMIGDWTSMIVDTEILSRILNGLGYHTELVPADDSGRYAAFQAGDLHIAVETWETTQAANFEASVATGKVLDLGETGLQAKEDWWFPNYMLEKCPGLPNWEALKEPACAEAFSTADTAPKGRYLSGPVGWGGYDAERIETLGLPWVAVNSGTDAGLFAELQAAYDRKDPIMLWVYAPHWASAKFDGQWVEFPKYEAGCYEDPTWGVNPDGLYDCGKPEGWIKKMGWAEGDSKWPCAYSVVRAMTFDNDTIGNLTAEVDLNGKTAAQVADEWLAANEAVWVPWTNECKAA